MAASSGTRARREFSRYFADMAVTELMKESAVFIEDSMIAWIV
jgi:hypothetical protein